MEDNEDEPEDVRKATPVEGELKKGAVDEDSGEPTKLPETRKKQHHCQPPPKKKLKEKSEGECCRAREAKIKKKEPKTIKVWVYEKPCVLPRLKPVPRHCISKKEWLEILAKPSPRCPSPCLKKQVTRRVIPPSARFIELGQPPKQRLLNTLQAKAGILPIEMVDRLIQRLETETCLTPEQAEKMFHDKETSKKKCPKGKKSKSKCGSGKSKNLETGIPGSVSPFDRDAVNCQYAMAESFVKSMLEWECPIPREEFKDIAGVIMKRLGYLLEYESINGEDRKSQQMRFLADVIGSWVSGVLFEVAETRKAELEEECERRKKEKAEESEEESEDDSGDDYPTKWDDDDDDDDDDDERPDDAPKPEDGTEEKPEKRPVSRSWGFRPSKDKNRKDDEDKGSKGTPPKKGSGESEKESFDDGKRKSSDSEKFYDARTGESQGIEEKKTPMKEPAEGSPRDVTSGKPPDEKDGEKITSEDEKGLEATRGDDERLKTDEKSEKIDGFEPEKIEGKEKGLGAEDFPVQPTEATEIREDEIPKKIDEGIPPEAQRIDDQERKHLDDVGSPEVPKTMVDPEAIPISVDAASALSATREPIAVETEVPEVEIELPKTDAMRSKEKTSSNDKKPTEPKSESVKMDASEKASEPPETLALAPEVAADTAMQLDEMQQVPQTSIAEEKPKAVEAETDKVFAAVPILGHEQEIAETQPEVAASTIAVPGKDQETPTVAIGNEGITEIGAQAERMAVPSTKLATVPVEAETKPEVIALGREPAEEARPEEPSAVSGEPQTRPEMTEPIPELADTRPEVPRSRPGSTPEAESKIEELKKIPEVSALAVPTSEPREEAKLSETDEERRKILDTSRRLSDGADESEKKLEKKKPKEYPLGDDVFDKKFRTDTPFVTFDKIFHTIYNAIENNEENRGDDLITNRIHRAVYEKCSNIVREEKPGPLSPVTKDVLEVMSGKIAIWLRNILTESETNFVEQYPATVESTEVREWTSWISFVSNAANDWSNWIQNTIREAEGLSNRPITRRDWTNWTENVDSDALKWRRFYLESLQQGRQNVTMIRDRRVVKTGTQQFHDVNDDAEKEVKITDLEVEKRNPDRPT
ncbi:uncharacterized protein [Venturia canescens]|uniref:uncharacterized protein n=1 Tax=Venturia canescens TaxID=32260 RepID=UPI001C9C8F7B|nr:uncharacterized protein LOC122412381 [Venturia canescens]